MGIRTYNPTSPGRRGASVSDFADLTPGAVAPKGLTIRKLKKGGRNNQGKITARHRGGGHKQHYRLIDFRREKDGVPGKVDSIQYDPNRTCRVALVHYADGEKRFILAPDGLHAGATVQSGASAPPEVGNCLPLAAIPLGMQVHNVELQAGRGGRLCRSAGSSAVLVARESQWAQLTLPSGEIRLPGHDRRDRQLGAHERRPGQGRAEAVDGYPSPRPWHGHEPDRSSARWR